MKNIRQIREEKEKVAPTSDEERKLAQLVRAGLFDAKKLAILKRALRKDNVQMTRQERDTLLQLLDTLLDMITGNRQLFTKVKQTVSEESETDEEFSMARGEIKTIMTAAKRILDKLQGEEGELEAWVQSKITKAEDYLTAVADHLDSGEALEEAKLDRTIRDINDLPNIIVLRRRAVRVFPDGYKVVMYWADKINRYIPIPVDPSVITRGVDLNEDSYAFHHNQYLKHMKNAYSQDRDEDHPEVTKSLGLAGDRLKTIEKKYGKAARERSENVGKNVSEPYYDRKKKEQSVIQATKKKRADAFAKKREVVASRKLTGSKGIISTAGKTLGSTRSFDDLISRTAPTAAGTAIRKLAAGGIRSLAKKLREEGVETAHIKMKKMSVSPIRGVSKTSASTSVIRERFEANLNENRQQIDEVVPLVAAGLATAARVALPAAARLAGRYLPRLMGAGSKTADAVSKGGKITNADRLTKRSDALKKLKARRSTKRANKIKKLAAAASGVEAGQSAASPAASNAQYSTNRRELGRISTASDSSKENRRVGDFSTRETETAKGQRKAFAAESNINRLKTIKENSHETLTFKDGNQIDVGYAVAKNIINIYESINKNNKQLMANMLDESIKSFQKVSEFAVRNRK